MKAQQFAASAPSEVLNQPPALEDYNLFEFDTPLRREDVDECTGRLRHDIKAPRFEVPARQVARSSSHRTSRRAIAA